MFIIAEISWHFYIKKDPKRTYLGVDIENTLQCNEL